MWPQARSGRCPKQGCFLLCFTHVPPPSSPPQAHQDRLTNSREICLDLMFPACQKHSVFIVSPLWTAYFLHCVSMYSLRGTICQWTGIISIFSQLSIWQSRWRLTQYIPTKNPGKRPPVIHLIPSIIKWQLAIEHLEMQHQGWQMHVNEAQHQWNINDCTLKRRASASGYTHLSRSFLYLPATNAECVFNCGTLALINTCKSCFFHPSGKPAGTKITALYHLRYLS